MIGVALQSAAHHRRSFLATGVVIFVGTALVTAMTCVLATGFAVTTLAKDRPFLIQFPAIMGSWILAIVVFAVLSTVSVALDRRTDEVTGLRLIGATPRQVRVMIALETAAVSIAAVIPGVAAGYGLGNLVVRQVHGLGLISPASVFAPGITLPALAGVIICSASTAGGYLGAKVAAHRSPVGAPDQGQRRARGPRARHLTAISLILIGLASSSTALAMDPASVYATAATGPGVVLTAVGLALLATEVLAVANAVLRRRAGSRSASWHLARINLRVVPGRLRPVVTFLTLFIGVSAGTLAMQGIENAATARSNSTGSIGAVMASINYFVVILIAAFMSVALVNNLLSAIHARTDELTNLSLVGATSRQIRRTLVAESAIAVVAGAVAAVLGAIVTVIPFAIAKLGNPMAALIPLPYAATIAVGASLVVIVTAAAAPRYR